MLMRWMHLHSCSNSSSWLRSFMTMMISAKPPTSSARACYVARAIPTSVCFHLSLHYQWWSTQQPLLQAQTLLFYRQSLRWVRFEVSVLRHPPEGRGYLEWRTLSALGSVLDKFSSLASPKLALVFGVCTLGGLSVARFTSEWAVVLIS